LGCMLGCVLGCVLGCSGKTLWPPTLVAAAAGPAEHPRMALHLAGVAVALAEVGVVRLCCPPVLASTPLQVREVVKQIKANGAPRVACVLRIVCWQHGLVVGCSCG
jgi:hypothetical protein